MSQLHMIIDQIVPLSELQSHLLKAIANHFNYSSPSNNTCISKLISTLRNDLFAYIEFPYVDKVYRDSYYEFYSSKHLNYHRDSIRVSLFNCPIEVSDFRSESGSIKLKENFLGFFILRPTMPQFIGRSMISPKALELTTFICCLTKADALVNGIKLCCTAFPHSSQDAETMTCAQTSIWSIMEYFGSKYAEYSPVLPSDILKAMEKSSFTRLLPATGLTVYQISLALRDFGFSTMIYSKQKYGSAQFKRLFYYYIDSGIPVIAALYNKKSGHAVVSIGYGIDRDNMTILKAIKKKGLKINKTTFLIDSGQIDKKIVLIDDNYPPYRVTSFKKPFDYYDNQDFKSMNIEHFVVPLYKRVYLEADRAHYLFIQILKNRYLGYRISNVKSGKIFLRIFLTSSRSFKSRVAISSMMNQELKDLLILTSMPKFIWIAEISTEKEYLQNTVSGIIIVDATGRESVNSIKWIVYPGKVIGFDQDGNYQVINEDYGEFEAYTSNLKGEWCKWQT